MRSRNTVTLKKMMGDAKSNPPLGVRVHVARASEWKHWTAEIESGEIKFLGPHLTLQGPIDSFKAGSSYSLSNMDLRFVDLEMSAKLLDVDHFMKGSIPVPSHGWKKIR